MDLIPTPEQLLSATGNVAHKLLYGGVADLRPMPRTLIDAGELREVYRYLPLEGVAQRGDPILLVTPLAAPALCFDLRRGCSLVEHLLQQGHPVHLVEYGQVSFSNRALGMEHWVEEVVPDAVRAVAEHNGGRGVHVVGWSLGGIFALLAAADSPDLPIASLSVVGSPVDVAKVPLMAPLRPLIAMTPVGHVVTRAYRAMGGIPVPLVNWGFAAASVQKLLTKPLVVATHLDDTELLAQLEAVDRFMDSMHAYPGRTFGQLFHRFVKGNALAGGELELGGRTIALDAITAPVLVFAGNTDGIAPVAAVRPVVAHLGGSEEVAFEIVPGGHLGMLTGRGARTTTWVAIDEWVQRWDGRLDAAGAAPDPRRRRATAPTKKAASRKQAPTKKATPKKAAGKKAAPRKAAPKTAATADSGIGTNRARRYSSASSRHLSSTQASPRTP